MSHPTSPATSTTSATPPMSPEDARFFAVKEDDAASAVSAWQSVEAHIQAQADTPAALPSVDIDYAASEVIRLAPTLAKLRAPTLALLSPTQAPKTAQALDSLPRLAFALLHVLRLAATESPTTPSPADLNAEGLPLRDRALGWCATLEALGKLPKGTARAIRKGRMSYHETAADLLDLFNALSPHRAQIATLNAHAAQPLTDADIDHMARLATLLRATTAQSPTPLSWRVALLRLAHHFAHTYHVAHACIRLHLTLSNDPTDLPSFNGLRRPPSKQPPSA